VIEMSKKAKVYVVTKEGVYRQEIGGIFRTPEEAKETARNMALNDRDSYHKYEVREFVLGEPTRQLLREEAEREGSDWVRIGSSFSHVGDLLEPDELFSVKKSDIDSKTGR
jgi:hypothetical protein